MNYDPIENVRDRLIKELERGKEPSKGFKIMPIRVTANNMPRMPQSNIPSQKIRYSRAGRPSMSEPQKYRKNWEGWL